MPQELSASEGVDRRIALRGTELFVEEQASLARKTDRLFAGLIACQWAAQIAVALWISPRTWAGAYSQTHLHVYAAVFLGGIITAFPVALAVLRPGRASTRHLIAAGQMLSLALLIHLMGGRIETHFHVFGSLAILAFYRDWRVLVTASAVVGIDHVVRGIFWPQSVYGVLTASPWRALEHAGWVAFEDAFLFVSIRRSLDATRQMAEKRAQIEASHEVVERKVDERTLELRASEQRFRSLSASSPVGIFENDADGSCIYTNDRWAALSGLSFDESLGSGASAATHPEDREGMVGAWLEATRKRTEFSREFRVLRPDGV